VHCVSRCTERERESCFRCSKFSMRSQGVCVCVCGMSQLPHTKFLVSLYLRVGDAHRNTPLHEACRLRKLSLARLLVQKGADVNIRNDVGETPLHFAIRSRDAKCRSHILCALFGSGV
jgi:Ankyrin repeats (3 copies)